MKPIPAVSLAHPLVLRAPFNKKTGYGHCSYYLARGLIMHQVPLRIQPIDDGMTQVPADLKQLVQPPGREEGWEILLFPPFALADRQVSKRTVVFTMWESGRLRPDWVKALNQSRAVIVPCEWNAVCFSASGVNVPIRVIALGHQPDIYFPRGDPPDTCTFGVAGALWDAGVRKNVPETVAAFRQAFPDEPDVRLKVKITQKCPLDALDDPRIEIDREHRSEAELAQWYRSLTALVSVSAGEAFSLHLLEAMACGRPVITCRFGGPADYFDETVGYPVAYEVVPATRYPVYEGLWCQFDRAGLIRTLRHVNQHRSEAAQKGRRAAQKAQAFTWDQMAEPVLAFLREIGMFAAAPRPAARGFWGAIQRMLKSA